MEARELAVVQGWSDTRATLVAWNHAPFRVLGRWVAVSFAVALALPRFSNSLATTAGWLFVAGTIVFSGSLYVLSLTETRWLGAITPIGGLMFLAGWLCLAYAALRAA